ncbi:hypothetical protein DUI87_33744 [Hirundo rustica rustica]|uniref:C2H2-type domain-containing protein n=1 Tax=Hirundo rustica rustica TaxID=333673 RepID=A0A3M0IPN5_HIRRU|nr:hypothetical protein DUI87_33744 [Hirundo rustica rustica]
MGTPGDLLAVSLQALSCPPGCKSVQSLWECPECPTEKCRDARAEEMLLGLPREPKEHGVSHPCNSDTCKNTPPSSSDSMVNIQFKWISSDFTTRVVKVCRNLLEAATQIVNLEQVIDRRVKIFDALLYAQVKIPLSDQILDDLCGLLSLPWIYSHPDDSSFKPSIWGSSSFESKNCTEFLTHIELEDVQRKTRAIYTTTGLSEENYTLLQEHCFHKTTPVTPGGLQPQFDWTASNTLDNWMSDKELRMETREDTSQGQNLMEEAILSGSTAQESNRKEKPKTSCSRRGSKPIPGFLENERPGLCWEDGQSFSHSSHVVQNQQGEALRVCGMQEELQPEIPLDHHQRIHSTKGPYMCEQCEKSFSQRSHLIHHWRIHAKERPYKSEQCRKSFSQSSHLICRQNIHAEERPYKCGECGKGFNQRYKLIIHLKIHTGERPDKCPKISEKLQSPPAPVDSHRGEALLLPQLQEGLQAQLHPHPSPVYPHWGNAQQVCGMQEGLPPELPTGHPPNYPQWGEAQRVWGIWDELQHEVPPDLPPEDPNQGMALHMSRLWEELVQELSLEQTPMETPIDISNVQLILTPSTF